MPALLRALLLALLFAAPAAAQAPAAAPAAAAPAAAAPAPPAALPAEAAARLRAILADEAQRAELLRALDALAGAAAPAAPAAPAAEAPALLQPDTLGAQIITGAGEQARALSTTLWQTLRTVTDLPGLMNWASGAVRDPVTQARLADAGWKVTLIIALGLLAEVLLRGATRRPRERIAATVAGEAGWRGWLARLPPALARFGLDLLGLGAFTLAAWGALLLLAPLPTTELIAKIVAYAYLAARGVMITGRLLLAPEPAIRLLPADDALAAYILRWLRRYVLLVVSAGALAETLLEFNLPWTVYDSILRVTLLVASLFAVVVILQKRETVAAALRAKPLPEGAPAPDASRRTLRLVRDQLAEIWHVLAILYLLALWGVWALQIPDGFERLLTGTALTLLILAGAKLADLAQRAAWTRLLQVSPDMARRYPGLQASSARYQPLLAGIVGIAIAFVAVLLVVEAWGGNTFTWFTRGALGGRIASAMTTIALTFLFVVAVWEVVNAFIQRQLEKLSRDAQAARSARVRTLLPMLRTVLGIILVIVLAVTVLTEIGVNVAPLLAGAGVLGLAIGFGSQTLVRDVITGIFLLLEDTVAVGDTVTLGGLTGTVEQLSIRSIKLRALDGSVHIIPFSAVTTVTNMTRDFAFSVLDISIGYGEDPDHIAEVLREISKEMRSESRWSRAMLNEIEVMGVDKLGDAAVVLRSRVKTEPSMRWAVGRELNRRIRSRFSELGIEMAAGSRKVIVVEQAQMPAAMAAARAGAID
jgi:small-conductance mechanosensitive channel